MKKVINLFVAISVMAMSICSCTKVNTYETVSADEFDKLIKSSNVQLVDVRTQSEYDLNHIEGALLIDVTASDFKEKALSSLDKNRQTAVYCASGTRSNQAARILCDEGYKVTTLSGGIEGWIKAGKPVISK